MLEIKETFVLKVVLYFFSQNIIQLVLDVFLLSKLLNRPINTILCFKVRQQFTFSLFRIDFETRQSLIERQLFSKEDRYFWKSVQRPMLLGCCFAEALISITISKTVYVQDVVFFIELSWALVKLQRRY